MTEQERKINLKDIEAFRKGEKNDIFENSRFKR